MQPKIYPFDDLTINAAAGEDVVIEFRNGSVRGRFYEVDAAAWRAAVDAATSAEGLEAYLRHNRAPSDQDAAYARDRFGRPWATPADAAKACTLHGAAGCQACQILTLEGELSGLMACLDAVREVLALPEGESASYGELAGHVEALRKERDAARAVIAKAHALVYDDGPNRIGVYVQLCNLLDDAMPAPAGN